jgi:hypothetical protein
MSNHQEPRFSEDGSFSPLLTDEQLRDAFVYAAAIVVVAFSLGCEFGDCTVDDDGAVWPTSLSRVEIKYPEDWRWKYGIFAAVAAIHEAGAMAVAKQRDHGPCRVNNSWTPHLFDDPKIWVAVKALARFIQENDEDHGNYGAAGMDIYDSPADSPAIQLIRSLGVTPGYGWKILHPEEPEDDE